MATTPTTLFTNSAMTQDAAIPVCLEGLSGFAALTTLRASEPRDAEVQAEIQQTLEHLSLEVLAKQAKQASSKTIARAFSASIEGVQSVYGSSLSTDPELLYLKKYYYLTALKALADLASVGAVQNKSLQISVPGSSWKYSDLLNGFQIAYAHYSALPDYETFRTSPSSFAASLADISGSPTHVGSRSDLSTGRIPDKLLSYLTQLRAQADYYAFADFLIRRNLSAVVDVPAWPGISISTGWQTTIDAHGGDINYCLELITMHATFAMFFGMQRSFQSVSVAEQGGTLLDCTTIALHTEFDRFAYHEMKTLAEHSAGTQVATGTNHAPSASLLLAGYHVAGGRVIGGVHEGPNMASSFPSQSYLGPLPMDPQSGAVSSSGVVYDIQSIAPTLVDAFGAIFPIQ